MKPAAKTARAAACAIGFEVLSLLMAVLGPAPEASAQPQPARIGLVSAAPAWGQLPSHKAFTEGMKAQGLIEGRDYVMEFRATGGDPGRIAPLTEALVRLPVDVLMTGVCGEWVEAARRATRTLPIVVMTCNEDMVEAGLVHSLNRPGGNVTGQSKLTPELAAKRLELLHEVLPGVRRVAVLWNPGYSAFKQDWQELRKAATQHGVTLVSVEFRSGADLDAAFESIRRLQPDALMTFSDAVVYSLSLRVGAFAAAARLPSVFAFREVVDAGGLMSYGPSITGMFRRGANYVARILRGTAPGDLPIEMPTRFELVVNQKAARALGIQVPNTVLLRADAVIE